MSDLWNTLVVSNETDEVVPLTQVADIRGEWAFFRINRRNQERCLTIEIKHESLLAPELLDAAMPLIEGLDLGGDYWWEPGGEIEQSTDTLGQLGENMPIALLGIVVLLIWQFNSFRRPAIIFITIPLAFVGAFLGLTIMRAPLDFFAMLGLLSLAGVIINNGIVLIDRIDSVCETGVEIQRCHHRRGSDAAAAHSHGHGDYHPWLDATHHLEGSALLLHGYQHGFWPAVRYAADPRRRSCAVPADVREAGATLRRRRKLPLQS